MTLAIPKVKLSIRFFIEILFQIDSDLKSLSIVALKFYQLSIELLINKVIFNKNWFMFPLIELFIAIT
jgi:hypothetical protein